MEKEKNKNIYGLIGRNISYSFSKEYFNKKFKENAIDNCEYKNFDCNELNDVAAFLSQLPPEIRGLNVTIPYKELVLPFLDKMTTHAKKIGAVNCIEITSEGEKIGHNTDWVGFSKSLKPFVKDKEVKAIILGTGGASRAVQYALKKMNIPFLIISRTASKKSNLTYENIEEEQIKNYDLIINCTPLGTFPDVHSCPEIPFQYLSSKNIVYDLVYNPTLSTLLKKSASKGSIIKNGYEMLTLQAEENWKIWRKNAVNLPNKTKKQR
jgi:shikimate dehydrogenase